MMDPALVSPAHNWSNEFTIQHWVCMRGFKIGSPLIPFSFSSTRDLQQGRGEPAPKLIPSLYF